MAPDDSTFRRTFLRCPSGDAEARCELIDNKPAWVVTSDLVSRDTAVVMVRKYHMTYPGCIAPRPREIPVLRMMNDVIAIYRFAWNKKSWEFAGDIPAPQC